MVFHLTYRSKAKSGLSANEIQDILKLARKRNSQNDITGCLLYNKGNFIQILEGEKQLVKEIFISINNDDRHNDVDILSEGVSQKRIFADWDMANYEAPEKILGKKALDIDSALLELSNTSAIQNETLKIFWYNIYALLSEKGFYRK
ncbi:MAG: hypothetical protein ACI815_001147 [Psychroserpens sp.]|jgi:hypothetical protein